MTAALQIALALAVLGGAFGLAIGSFLNVVVYRVPAGLSVVAPASACPNCKSEIRSYDNIPVISWLLLRGKCRDCHTPISARYPAVELFTAVLFVATAVAFAPGLSAADGVMPAIAGVLTLVAYLYLAAITVALALIDLDVHRLPNSIVLPGYLVGGTLLGAAGILTGDWAGLLRVAIGAVAMFVFYFALAFIKPGAMGWGDVKLAGVLGIYLGWLGWPQLILGAFAAFLLGGIASIVLIATKRVGRSGGIPFGPWMLAGAWISIFAGEPISHAYLALVGLV